MVVIFWPNALIGLDGCFSIPQSTLVTNINHSPNELWWHNRHKCFFLTTIYCTGVINLSVILFSSGRNNGQFLYVQFKVFQENHVGSDNHELRGAYSAVWEPRFFRLYSLSKSHLSKICWYEEKKHSCLSFHNPLRCRYDKNSSSNFPAPEKDFATRKSQCCR